MLTSALDCLVKDNSGNSNVGLCMFGYQFIIFTAMDDSISSCSSASQNMAMKHSQGAKRDFHQFGKSLTSVATAFSMQSTSSTDLAISGAVKNAGKYYMQNRL